MLGTRVLIQNDRITTPASEQTPHRLYSAKLTMFLFPSFSSKFHREEMEQLRREVDQLKTRLSESVKHTLHASCGSLAPALRDCTCPKSSVGLLSRDKHGLAHNVCSSFPPSTGRQEEDMFLQQAENIETKRQYERSCKVNVQNCSFCVLVLLLSSLSSLT